MNEIARAILVGVGLMACGAALAYFALHLPGEDFFAPFLLIPAMLLNAVGLLVVAMAIVQWRTNRRASKDGVAENPE